METSVLADQKHSPGRTPLSEPIFANLRSARISIIVPVFNEAEHIVQNLELLISEIEPYFENHEIIVVDDGSNDQTARSLASVRHPKVRVVHLPENHGKGYAVREGFKRAEGDFVFFIDGGMELHPKELRIFLGVLSLYEADIVVGSKRHPQSQVIYPTYRRLLSYFYQRLIRYLFDVDVTDTQVGMKLFRREVVDSVLDDLQLNRYGFDLEILSFARARGYSKILEAPIRLDYFLRGTRRPISDFFHVLRVGLSVVKDTIQLYFRVKPKLHDQKNRQQKQ